MKLAFTQRINVQLQIFGFRFTITVLGIISAKMKDEFIRRDKSSYCELVISSLFLTAFIEIFVGKKILFETWREKYSTSNLKLGMCNYFVGFCATFLRKF
jgi:hypothetical protein